MTAETRRTLGVLSLLLACACAPARAPEAQTTARLAADLSALPGGNSEEAHRLATAVVRETEVLARHYRVTSPALLHNALVSVGLRDAGLCCHWTRALLDRVAELDLVTYRAVWGVAHHGNALREHSSVVVTTEGQPFGDGIAIDAWRGAGALAWARTDADRYRWQPHPEDRFGVRIDCR